MVKNYFQYLGAPFQGVPPALSEGKQTKPANTAKDHIHAFGVRIVVPRKKPPVVSQLASNIKAKVQTTMSLGSLPPAPPPLPHVQRERKLAVQKASLQAVGATVPPIRTTTATNVKTLMRSSAPPAPRPLAPEQKQRNEQRAALAALKPKLQADLVRSLQFAHTPDAVMPKELLASLAEIDGKVPVGLHAHMKNAASRKYTHSGFRSVHNDVDGSVIKSEYGNITGHWQSPRDSNVRTLVESFRTFYGSPTNPRNNVESVRLSLPSGGGTKLVIYRYEGNSYFDTAEISPGVSSKRSALLAIGIELPPKQAEALYKIIKQNPEQARAFFICAGQNVSEADYIWANRTPSYDVSDEERKLVFVDEAANETMGKSLADPDVQVLELIHMVKKGGTWSETDFPQAALTDYTCNPAVLKTEALKRARRDASKKPRR